MRKDKGNKLITQGDAEEKKDYRTPIEVALEVDGHSKVEARKLYKWLGLADGQFIRWAKSKIIENEFAIENEDYMGFDIIVEGNKTIDFKLTVPFAKKLAMGTHNERGEQAKDYFIKVEDKLREIAIKQDKLKSQPDTKAKEIEARYNNSVARKVRELRRIAEDPTTPKEYRVVLNSKATEMLTGEKLLPLPVAEKTYSAGDIAKELGISANMVGKIANANNLKTPEFGVLVWDKSPYSPKQIQSWRYNELGRAKLIDLIKHGGSYESK